jgi:hypothetical protein
LTSARIINAVANALVDKLRFAIMIYPIGTRSRRAGNPDPGSCQGHAALAVGRRPSHDSRYIIARTGRCERNVCHVAVVIGYSSLTIGIRQDSPSFDANFDRVKHIVARPNIGKNDRYWDPWIGNPLVAGSSPARPTSELYDLG